MNQYVQLVLPKPECHRVEAHMEGRLNCRRVQPRSSMQTVFRCKQRFLQNHEQRAQHTALLVAHKSGSTPFFLSLGYGTLAGSLKALQRFLPSGGSVPPCTRRTGA